MTYLTDKHRHLICTPYSIEKLHEMAYELDIKRCWFHAGNHYDIPLRRLAEIESKCQVVTSKELIAIIRNHEASKCV